MVNSNYINKLIIGHGSFIEAAKTAERYYANKNDIKNTGAANLYMDAQMAEANPLRTADNRISHNWHSLLVNQKCSYLFTYPPTFDVGDKSANKIITDTLGDDFPKVSNKLAVDASNDTVGWLHYWKGEDNTFQYAAVDPKQIIPVMSGDLKNKIIGILRAYVTVNDKGEEVQRCEYWDDKEVKFFEKASSGAYVNFNFPSVGTTMSHNMGAVPFIPFFNNTYKTSDLSMCKDQIDAYDRTVSGFANDIDDVQEVIFVIKNYGGVDRDDFLSDLKVKKTIKVEGEGGVETIRAEIPYEARGAFLELLKKQIFISGMGVDPDPQKYGNTSGEALKFMYSLLELKAGAMETEFRSGYAELVKAICRFHGLSEPKKIIQTWTRNSIKNDLETAQIAQQSIDVISRLTVVKNHPWVEDTEEEMKQIEKEQNQNDEARKQSFGMVNNNPPGGEEDEE